MGKHYVASLISMKSLNEVTHGLIDKSMDLPVHHIYGEKHHAIHGRSRIRTRIRISQYVEVRFLLKQFGLSIGELHSLLLIMMATVG
jgi:hypothetical protein